MRFHGRWDSIDAKYRTMYTGDSLLACLIELLAPFRGVARVFGLDDFDTAALKSARPRELTQQVSQHLWEAGSVSGGDLCDGIEFASRHGDDLKLWAIFERPQDGDTSLRLTQITPRHLTRDTPELLEACDRLRIKAV